MPELPDITIYCEALAARVGGARLERVRLATPFLLRTVEPPLESAVGRRVVDVRRIGKRIVLVLEGELLLVLHLMIAGRLRWAEAGAKVPGKVGLAAFDFETGTLLLTEAGTKRRASLHLVSAGELGAVDRGGVEPLEAGPVAFREAIVRESHTLKRALTDPRLVSGVGNAYSDEILHRAKLSPVRLTGRVTDEEHERLYGATVSVLTEWTDRLRAEANGGFPEKVTAFRPEMRAHGKYGKPCPDCGTAIQRIRYADNETNYCPRCQNDGKLLADRALSRLLKADWPRTMDELERRAER
jgi:formamidopyrimidine-DNA glycosylase